MKDFNIMLCAYGNDRINVTVRAKMEKDILTITGEDYGKGVEQFWGDDDYEYYYSFDETNTMRLLELIGGKTDPETALENRFSGLDGCKKLREVCNENNIRYRFITW